MSEYPIKLFEGQVNFIKFLRFHPCADKLQIMVETFFPCALQLAIDLYLYDHEDVAREVLRQYPKGGKGVPSRRGLRHASKKKSPTGPKSRKVVKAVPFIRKPFVMGFSKFLFEVTAPLERIGFAMLFYGAVDNFFYNWTTLLVHRGYCSLPASTGPLIRTANAGSQFFSSGGNPISMPNIIQNRAGWGSNNVSAGLLPGSYTAILSITIKNNGLIGWLGIRAVIKTGTYPVSVHSYASEPVDVGPEQEVTLFVAAEVGTDFFILNGVWWEIDSVVTLSGVGELKAAQITIYQNYTEISF